jgi:hypothetical protein
MTRHTSLSALRRCHPTLLNSVNGSAPLSVSPYASVGIASSQLLSHALPRPFSRQLHLSTPRLSSAAPQPKPEPEPSTPPQTQPDSEVSPSPETQVKAQIADDPLNPPSTTRPPALNLPVKSADTSTIGHLYATGKAFLQFYKTGLRQIWTNQKLVRSLPPASPAEPRATTILRLRSAHDVRRLPVFGLLLLICGEFTPFVVLLLPQVVPFTCRIPKQVRKLRAGAEERSAAARQEGKWRRESGLGTSNGGRGEEAPLVEGVELPIVARILGVVGQGWDRIGWVPGALAKRRVEGRWDFLVRDDDALRRDTDAVGKLEDQEVQLACLDRGILTVDREVTALRAVLSRWLELTAGRDEAESRVRMEWLVTRGEAEWPETWPPKNV